MCGEVEDISKASPGRRACGFTIMETILTVAVLAVLVAIAFPALSATRTNLKMNELDAAARHIFIAAQNQISSLHAAGSLGGISGSALPGMPADYTGSDWSSLTYLTEADTGVSGLLPAGAIEPKLAGSYYVLEFDRSTASIYGVFYSEESFDYSGTVALRQRDRETRKANTPLIGYYGGAVMEGSGATALPQPEITIVNEETLTVSMTTANPFGGTVTDADFFSDLTYLVTVRSADDPAKFRTFSTDPAGSTAAYFSADYAHASYTLLLDSLTSGGHFREICDTDTTGIIPGDNLTVTVTVSYDGPGGTALPASAAKTTNSLFAGRSGNAVTVAFARHLQNLEPTVSGVSTVASAVQTASIDWGGTYAGDFIPISNSELTDYDGNGLAVANITAGPNGDCSGLFGSFAGGTLSGISLTDAVIYGGVCSGGLAGRCDGATEILGCRLYVTDLANVSQYIISGTHSIGGLVGRCDGALTISDSFAAPARVYGGSASIYIGGLVGYCGTDSALSRCYADTDVHGDASPDLGGLIGHCGAGGAVTDCYALGNLSSVGSLYFGGLAGGSSTTTYTNCYAAPTFDNTGGASTPYGFAGSMSNTYINCACLQSAGFAVSDPTAAFAPVTYSALQSWIGGDAWTAASAANSHPYDPYLIASGLPYPFPRLKTLEHYNDWPDRPVLPPSSCFTYYETYSDGTRGYYATDSAGRVAVNTLSDVKGAVVFDGYCLLSVDAVANRDFRFESRMGELDGTFDDMGTVTVTADGASMTYHVYGVPRWILLWDDYSTVDFYVYITHLGTTYWYNPHFAKAAVNGHTTRPPFGGTARVRASRHLAAIGSTIYTAYLDSSFTFQQELALDYTAYPAAVAFTIGTSLAPFEGDYNGNGYSVTLDSSSSSSRAALFEYTAGTVRNLNVYTSGSFSIGDTLIASGVLAATNTGTIQNCTVSVGSGMTVRGAPFGGIAGVNSGAVSDCRITYAGSISVTGGSGNPGGFVGSNSGAVTNGLVTTGPGGAVFAAGYNTMAGFAGSNSGTLSNCSLRPGTDSYAGFTLNSSYRAAGFVLSNSGTITGCSATGVFNGGANEACYAVGFVHTNTGTIARCYANCLVTGYHAAGFAFVSSDPAAAVTNCYSMLQVTADTSGGVAAGFIREGGTGISDCYAVTEVTGRTTYTFTADTCGADCYYLSWSGCGYNSTGTGLSMTELAHAFDDDPASWGGADTYVYLDQYDDLIPPCPYPLITGLDHYGDWLDEPYYVPPVPMFVYFERYSDSSYGYYTMEADGSTALYDTLSDTRGAVTDDGYLMLSPVPFDNTNRSFTLQTAIGTYTFWSEDLGSVTLDYHGTSETFYRYNIPDYVYGYCDYADASFYQTMLIDGTTYWYNPHFARAAVTGAAGIPAFDGTAYVRSARQLANLGNSTLSAYWGSGFTFRQELDLDFTTYSFSIASPVGTSSSAPFAGVYDGGGKTIVLTSAAKGSKNALFGYSTGTLRDIHIATSGSFTMGSAGAASGILAAVNTGAIEACTVTFGTSFTMTGTPFGTIVGSNSGTATNCLVTGSAAVTLSGGGNTGAGFAGSNSGSISSCRVRPGTAAYAGLTLSGTNRIAGFVYTNSGTVTDSSVTGAVSVGTNNNRYAAGFVFTNTGSIGGCYANCLVTGRIAAGFAYDSSAAGAAIQNCYSMIRVTAYNRNGGYAAGFVYQGGGGISNCYAAAQLTGNRSYTFSGSGTLGAGCYYYNWSGCGGTATGTAATLAALQSAFGAWPWGEADTYVYQDLYTGLPPACPYPLIQGLDHYGDWIP